MVPLLSFFWRIFVMIWLTDFKKTAQRWFVSAQLVNAHCAFTVTKDSFCCMITKYQMTNKLWRTQDRDSEQISCVGGFETSALPKLASCFRAQLKFGTSYRWDGSWHSFSQRERAIHNNEYIHGLDLTWLDLTGRIMRKEPWTLKSVHHKNVKPVKNQSVW